MLLHRGWCCFRSSFSSRGFPRRWYSTPSSSTQIRPLRILYCGSDEFSVTSLKKLHEEHLSNSNLVKSLDVVCKKGKPTGRGLKVVRDVPIKSVAEELKLSLHEIDTFTGWTPPTPYNLIIAVSFGLKVPPRLLNAAEYGGLNLHPSLLPDLRGPAPLHHTLLRGRTDTGITLQTLDPDHFDHGRIIAQTHFELPHKGRLTIKDLTKVAKVKAADLLIENLRTGKFVATEEPVPTALRDGTPTHARKITPEDSCVDWLTWPMERILRVQRVLGELWSYMQSAEPNGQEPLRVQWHDVKGFVPNEWTAKELSDKIPPGWPQVLTRRSLPGDLGPGDTRTRVVALRTCDGGIIVPRTVTIAGKKKHADPLQVVQVMFGGKRIMSHS